MDFPCNEKRQRVEIGDLSSDVPTFFWVEKKHIRWVSQISWLYMYIKYNIYICIYTLYIHISIYIYMDMPHVAHQLAISKSIFQVNLNPTVDFFPPWSLRIRPKNHWNYPPLMQKQGLVASRCHLDVSKNRGKTPKMDGLMVYNGKPYKNG